MEELKSRKPYHGQYASDDFDEEASVELGKTNLGILLIVGSHAIQERRTRDLTLPALGGMVYRDHTLKHLQTAHEIIWIMRQKILDNAPASWANQSIIKELRGPKSPAGGVTKDHTDEARIFTEDGGRVMQHRKRKDYQPNSSNNKNLTTRTEEYGDEEDDNEAQQARKRAKIISSVSTENTNVMHLTSRPAPSASSTTPEKMYVDMVGNGSWVFVKVDAVNKRIMVANRWYPLKEDGSADWESPAVPEHYRHRNPYMASYCPSEEEVEFRAANPVPISEARREYDARATRRHPFSNSRNSGYSSCGRF